MTDTLGDLMLAGSIVCGVMILVWGFRLKSSRVSALINIAAFVLMAILFQGIRFVWHPAILIALGVVVVLLLIADALYRLANKQLPEDK